MSDQDFDVSAEGKLWRNDCPAVWWFIDTGVCQEKWSWFVKVGDGNQLETSCQCNESCSPELYVNDSVVLCLLFGSYVTVDWNGQHGEWAVAVHVDNMHTWHNPRRRGGRCIPCQARTECILPECCTCELCRPPKRRVAAQSLSIPFQRYVPFPTIKM